MSTGYNSTPTTLNPASKGLRHGVEGMRAQGMFSVTQLFQPGLSQRPFVRKKCWGLDQLQGCKFIYSASKITILQFFDNRLYIYNVYDETWHYNANTCGIYVQLNILFIIHINLCNIYIHIYIFITSTLSECYLHGDLHYKEYNGGHHHCSWLISLHQTLLTPKYYFFTDSSKKLAMFSDVWGLFLFSNMNYQRIKIWNSLWTF